MCKKLNVLGCIYWWNQLRCNNKMTSNEKNLTKHYSALSLHLVLIFFFPPLSCERVAPAGHDWLFDRGLALGFEGGSYKRSAALLHVPAPRCPCANSWSRWQQTAPHSQPESQLTWLAADLSLHESPWQTSEHACGVPSYQVMLSVTLASTELTQSIILWLWSICEEGTLMMDFLRLPGKPLARANHSVRSLIA